MSTADRLFWNSVALMVFEMEHDFHGTEFVIEDGRVREVIEEDGTAGPEWREK